MHCLGLTRCSRSRAAADDDDQQQQQSGNRGRHEHSMEAAGAEWMRRDPNPETRAEMERLVSEGGDKAEARLLKRIAFGTAGLRALMAAGNTCMNDLVVLQTTQGVERYLRATLGDERVESGGVVIGHDARYNSRRFAQVAAASLVSRGVPVVLFSRIVATPLVPFGVQTLGAAAGIMVTASHNPKQDNGYKLYWENGAQIIPPHDAGIASAIGEELEPDYCRDGFAASGSYASKLWQYDAAAGRATGAWFDGGRERDGGIELPASALLRLDRTDEIIDAYFARVSELYVWEREANAASAEMRVTYTAMHGVGTPFVRRAFEVFGLPPFVPVAEQVEPDPDFSTVEFPNPEEGKGALALAIRAADAAGSRLILANDPDADRLAVAERPPGDGAEWRIFNGNEIAALFADYVWRQYVAREGPSAEERAKAFMLASTVSSKFLAAMADAEGFVFRDTLTGFKWMGNTAIAMERDEGMRFLFAYEVEIGFLAGNISMDKDGVRMAGIFAEMANQLRLEGKTCAARLEELYAKYGYYEMNTSYFFCGRPEPMSTIFDRLRTGGEGGGYLKRCGEHTVTNVRDVTRGYDSSQPGDKSLFPAMPDQQMLTFHFDNGAVCTIRNSGTEPKLKYYVECNDRGSQEAARRLVDDMTETIVREFIQPQVHGLKGKKKE